MLKVDPPHSRLEPTNAPLYAVFLGSYLAVERTRQVSSPELEARRKLLALVV